MQSDNSSFTCLTVTVFQQPWGIYCRTLQPNRMAANFVFLWSKKMSHQCVGNQFISGHIPVIVVAFVFCVCQCVWQLMCDFGHFASASGLPIRCASRQCMQRSADNAPATHDQLSCQYPQHETRSKPSLPFHTSTAEILINQNTRGLTWLGWGFFLSLLLLVSNTPFLLWHIYNNGKRLCFNQEELLVPYTVTLTMAPHSVCILYFYFFHCFYRCTLHILHCHSSSVIDKHFWISMRQLATTIHTLMNFQQVTVSVMWFYCDLAVPHGTGLSHCPSWFHNPPPWENKWVRLTQGGGVFFMDNAHWRPAVAVLEHIAHRTLSS